MALSSREKDRGDCSGSPLSFPEHWPRTTQTVAERGKTLQAAVRWASSRFQIRAFMDVPWSRISSIARIPAWILKEKN